MAKVYLSLGSNMGDRVGFIKQATDYFKNYPHVSNVESSSFYETDPQGYLDQDNFINVVLSLDTSLSPIELLDYCQLTEQKMKRKRLFRWGPRTIDIDILLYGEKKINIDRLEIPHPRMYERAFVMIPLSQLDSSFKSFLKDVDGQGVVLLKD